MEYAQKARFPISGDNRDEATQNHDIKVMVSKKHDINVVVHLYDSLQQGNSLQLPP